MHPGQVDASRLAEEVGRQGLEDVQAVRVLDEDAGVPASVRLEVAHELFLKLSVDQPQ